MRVNMVKVYVHMRACICKMSVTKKQKQETFEIVSQTARIITRMSGCHGNASWEGWGGGGGVLACHVWIPPALPCYPSCPLSL